MKAVLGLSLVSLVALLPAPVQAQTKKDTAAQVALVSSDKSDAVRNVLTLAEAKLSQTPGLKLLERQAIDKVLAEQKLSLSGVVATDQALTIGKLLSVDLFAVLEASEDKKEAAGLVIFDAKTGVRLWDAALPAGTLDETVNATVDAVRTAQHKRVAVGQLRPVCLMTVRNADLPRDLDVFCDAVGLLLERQLVASPDLAILERRRLEQVNKESDLPTDSPLRPLLASVVTIELEVGAAPDGKGLRATALLSDGKGKSLGKVTATVANRDAAELARGLLKELAKALNAKAGPVASGGAQEAGRFLSEAEFFWAHQDSLRALRAAESAYALNPKDLFLRAALAPGLMDYAIEVISSGGQNLAGYLNHKVESEKLQWSLELARRGSELLVEIESEATDAKLRQWFGFSHKSVAIKMLKFYLPKITGRREDPTSADRKAIASLWNLLNQIHDIRIERARAALHDKQSFDSYSEEVNFALMTALNPAMPSSQWSIVVQRLRPWAEFARKYEDDRAKTSQSLLTIAVLTYDYFHELDTTQVAQLQKLWAELEQHLNPTIAVYGRLGGLKNVLRYEKLSNEERRRQVRDFRLFVQERLEKGAKEPDALRINLYQAGVFGIQLLLPDQAVYLQEMKELCEFMFHRKELATGVTQPTAFLLSASPKPEDYRYAYDICQRVLDLLDGKEGRILSTFETPELRQQDRNHIRSEYLNRQCLIRQTQPSVGPPPATPWEKTISLLDVYSNKEGILWIQQPVIHKEVIYTAAIRREGTPPKQYVQLLRLTPGKEDKWEGRRLEVSVRLHDLEGSPVDYTHKTVHFGTSACVHQDRYYLGTKEHGLFAFPLDGGVPERITMKDGLPSDYVQALACLGNRLYAHLGEPQKDSYFVAWDMKARKCDILASSRRKEKRSPFDDSTPLVTSLMLADPVRGQVIFSSYSYHVTTASLEVDGVWALDAKTETFSRLFVLNGSDLALVEPTCRIEDDRLLMPSKFGHIVYDLKKNNHRLLYGTEVSLEVSPRLSARYQLRSLPPYREWDERGFLVSGPFLVVDGWVWGAQPFSRRTFDGRTQELLAPLRSGTRFFHPTESLQFYRGDRELLMGDTFGLWLVTLPTRK